jgi:hypothetical protein
MKEISWKESPCYKCNKIVICNSIPCAKYQSWKAKLKFEEIVAKKKNRKPAEVV